MADQIYGIAGESCEYFGMISNSQNKKLYIKMQCGRPTENHVAQEDGTWALSESKLEEAYEVDIAALDPLMSHILRHDLNGESKAKARAELKFKIAQAEIMEKYGKGSTVLITENGVCYHKDRECTGLANSINIVEINLSDGLKNYSPCSMCCN